MIWKTVRWLFLDGDPYAVLEVRHQHIGRGGSNVQTRLKNVRTGQVLERNFKPADAFQEAEIEKKKTRFLYEHRGTFGLLILITRKTGFPCRPKFWEIRADF